MIFQFGDQPYAVPNAALKELFKLPKLTAVEQSIACLAGTVNCRGKIIPVLDFAAVMGHPRASCVLDDVVMVLECEGHSMGLIVSDVRELQAVEEASITPLPAHLLQPEQTSVLRGQSTGCDQELLSIIDVAALFTHPAAHLAEVAATTEETASTQADAHFDWQQFDSAARQILAERARKIALSAAPAEQTGTEALALIRISGESFGIRLDSVREFTTARRIMPLPSCPAHIAGSMNLRGDVLTLLDLRGALHLAAHQKQDKVVVMHTPELGLFGVLTDSIEQVLRLTVQDASRLPAGLDKFEASYLNGVAHWDETEVPVLDIPAMLLNGGMIVNETV
jgi:purine-binding chemotaxis protein CheW